MKISGYVTCRSALLMDYPLEECIRSLVPFSDEIVVCDSSDEDDGTRELLLSLQDEFELGFLKIIWPDKKTVDWSTPNHGIYDGICKAIARQHCNGDYCFQIDADEIADCTREQMEKTIEAADNLEGEYNLAALPIIEFWGSEKIRIDVNPWKWRLSKNLSDITHGIPAHLRKYENGLLYAKPGSDGCDYISKDTGQIIPCLNFVKPQVEQVRRLAITDPLYVEPYEKWLNKIINRLPTIYHFSWWSIYAKMQKYRLFWNDSWMSLYNEQRPEGYNPFFDKPFDQVTDEEMRNLAQKLEKDTAGHIFHSPYIEGKTPKTNSVKLYKNIPTLIENWAGRHRD